MKHTPGPWTWDAGDIGTDMSEPYCEVVKDDLLIASVNDRFDRDEGRANARLIAAAPALLEACRRALPELEFDARHCPSDSPLNATVSAIKEAIKLAEGK